MFSAADMKIYSVKNCSLRVRIAEFDVTENNALSVVAVGFLRVRRIDDLRLECEKRQHIRQKKIVLVEHGDAAEQLPEISLATLQGLIKHHKVAHGHHTLKSPISEKTIQGEPRNNSADLCEQSKS